MSGSRSFNKHEKPKTPLCVRFCCPVKFHSLARATLILLTHSQTHTRVGIKKWAPVRRENISHLMGPKLN